MKENERNGQLLQTFVKIGFALIFLIIVGIGTFVLLDYPIQQVKKHTTLNTQPLQNQEK